MNFMNIAILVRTRYIGHLVKEATYIGLYLAKFSGREGLSIASKRIAVPRSEQSRTDENPTGT
jgi:hypothetical protein